MQVVRPQVEFNVGGRGGDEQEQGRDRSFCPSSSHNFSAITRIRNDNVINVVWHHVEFA